MPRYTLLPILFVIFNFSVFCGGASAADSYLVNDGFCETIEEHSECRGVENNAGQTIMVPTKSSGEWSSFYNNAPGGVTINACISQPGGGGFTASDWQDEKSCSGDTSQEIDVLDKTIISEAECRNFCNSYPSATCCTHFVATGSEAIYPDKCIAYENVNSLWVRADSCQNPIPGISFCTDSNAQLSPNSGGITGCP